MLKNKPKLIDMTKPGEPYVIGTYTGERPPNITCSGDSEDEIDPDNPDIIYIRNDTGKPIKLDINYEINEVITAMTKDEKWDWLSEYWSSRGDTEAGDSSSASIPECKHEWVNVSFTGLVMACKYCDINKPEDTEYEPGTD